MANGTAITTAIPRRMRKPLESIKIEDRSLAPKTFLMDISFIRVSMV